MTEDLKPVFLSSHNSFQSLPDIHRRFITSHEGFMRKYGQPPNAMVIPLDLAAPFIRIMSSAFFAPLTIESPITYQGMTVIFSPNHKNVTAALICE